MKSSTPLKDTAKSNFTARAFALPIGWLLLLGGMLLAQICAATPFQWEFTGSLNTARHHHTATLLPDGMVLAAGGFDTSAIASAELYDPANGTWSFTGSLNVARNNHTATLLSNGLVLVAGGSDTSAELYDPASGTWTITGSLRNARFNHMAILLPDGKVLVAGGLSAAGRPLASAELYDPLSGTWSLTGSLNTARWDTVGMPSTLLPDGTVLVEGGVVEHSVATASAEIYDPASGTWSATGGLNTARYDHTATLLPDGTVLVAGGDDSDFVPTAEAELYNPAVGTWTPTGSLIEEHTRHTATLLSNGLVLVAGGLNFTGFTTDAELYDPATATWGVTGSLNAARADYTATLLPSGMVLAAAGFDGGTLNSAELYDPGITMATTINGRGAVMGLGDQATFNFHVMQTDDRPMGSFSFNDPGASVSIAKAKARTLTITGNSADFSGTARLEDGTRVTFDVSITDNGDGTSDTFSISLSNGYTAGGNLTKGDIQIF